jgi:hypothetical protein
VEVPADQLPQKDSVARFTIEFFLCWKFDVACKLAQSKVPSQLINTSSLLPSCSALTQVYNKQNITLALDGTTKGQSWSLLVIRFGGLLGEEEWSATVGILDLVNGKMAKEQVRVIEEVWHDLQHCQERMGVQVKGLYEIWAISFNNASDNRGAKKGIHAKLDRR